MLSTSFTKSLLISLMIPLIKKARGEKIIIKKNRGAARSLIASFEFVFAITLGAISPKISTTMVVIKVAIVAAVPSPVLVARCLTAIVVAIVERAKFTMLLPIRSELSAKL